jgi:hypothetical protein
MANFTAGSCVHTLWRWNIAVEVFSSSLEKPEYCLWGVFASQAVCFISSGINVAQQKGASATNVLGFSFPLLYLVRLGVDTLPLDALA